MSRRCREVVIATHPAFEQLSETYKYFREYSSFLYTGMIKVTQYGIEVAPSGQKDEANKCAKK